MELGLAKEASCTASSRPPPPTLELRHRLHTMAEYWKKKVAKQLMGSGVPFWQLMELYTSGDFPTPMLSTCLLGTGPAA
jgi:hypothetical protein